MLNLFKTKFSLIFVILFGALIFSGYSLTPVTKHASWADSQKNIEEAFNNSDIVLIANVNTSKSYKLYESVFTNYKINVVKTFKGSEKFSPNKIEVRLNGGNLGLKQYKVIGQEMLQNNNTYLFMLKKVWPDDPNSQEYAPIGGFQGVISLTDLNGYLVGQDFNSVNRLEKELKGKDVTSLLKTAKQ